MSFRARIASMLGLGCIEFGAKVKGNVKIGKKVYIDSGAEVVASGNEEITIGDNSFILRGSLLYPYGGRISIGQNVNINPYCLIYGAGGLTIGDNVMIATSCVIIPSSHNHDRTDIPMTFQGITCKGIKIGNDVWLGARVVVTDGVEIGEGSIIGAGAIVSRNIPPYSIAVGVPARVVKSRL